MMELERRIDQLEEEAHYLTTAPPYTEVTKYANPGDGKNLYQPQFFYSASNTVGVNYQVGVRNSPVSTLLYYYGDVANLWYVEDTGYKCDAFDVDFGQNT